jgi:ABC-type dipeptide/oligopeptide/nickel transport system permease component
VEILVPRAIAAGVATVMIALLATIVGTAAGILAKMDGNSWPSAISRGAMAFGGAFTLGLGVLAFTGTWLQ